MNDNVTLRVNGREWNGWTSVRIGAGVERLARDFSVEITRQYREMRVSPRFSRALKRFKSGGADW